MNNVEKVIKALEACTLDTACDTSMKRLCEDALDTIQALKTELWGQEMTKEEILDWYNQPDRPLIYVRYRDLCGWIHTVTGDWQTAMIHGEFRCWKRMPQPMTLDELLTTSGAGWEETWFSDDGEEPAIALEPCAWVHGKMILESGSSADLTDDRVNATYGKQGRGFRIWRGDKPTEEQRAAVKWELEGGI